VIHSRKWLAGFWLLIALAVVAALFFVPALARASMGPLSSTERSALAAADDALQSAYDPGVLSGLTIHGGTAVIWVTNRKADPAIIDAYASVLLGDDGEVFVRGWPSSLKHLQVRDDCGLLLRQVR